MNNPYNLSPEERGITPTQSFNKGIGSQACASPAARKQKNTKRQAINAENRKLRASLHSQKANGKEADRPSMQLQIDAIGASQQT